MVYVDGRPINPISEIQYIKITLVKNYKKEVKKVIVDYGQGDEQESTLTDENNKALYINSDVDAMNFMFHSGWRFISNYQVTNSMGTAFNTVVIFERMAST